MTADESRALRFPLPSGGHANYTEVHDQYHQCITFVFLFTILPCRFTLQGCIINDDDDDEYQIVLRGCILLEKAHSDDHLSEA